MGLANLLSIARSALTTHQAAIETASHNIANASTEGYTRQRMVAQAVTPQRTPYGALGRGVTIDRIERLRNQFLDVRYREERALQGRNATLNQRLAEIEAILGEPSDTGLSSEIDRFYAAWSDLALDPSGGASRTIVQHAGRRVANLLNQLHGRVAGVSAGVNEQVTGAVGEVNELAREIAHLNTQIVEVEAGGGTASDLRDRRDVAVDRIGELLPVRTVDHANGSVRVLASDSLIADHGISQQLVVRTSAAGRVGLGLQGGVNFFEPISGEMSGLLETLNDQIPGITGSLDRLAAALVSEVNTLHRTGINGQGMTGIDFFDANTTSASTIRLAAGVDTTADSIAAGTTGAAGDGALALQLSGLRNQTVTALGGMTINEFYTQTVAGLGADVQTAGRIAEAQDVLVTNLEGQRDSAHAVSVDEEMVSLITHQQAYSAATRIVTVADEMVRELLQMV